MRALSIALTLVLLISISGVSPTSAQTPVVFNDCFDFTTDPDTEITYDVYSTANHEIVNLSGNDVVRSTWISSGITVGSVTFNVNPAWNILGVSFDSAVSSGLSNQREAFVVTSEPLNFIQIGDPGIYPDFAHRYRTAFEFPTSGQDWINVQVHRSGTGHTVYIDNVCIAYEKYITAPVASFTFDPDEGYAPSSVDFTSTSTGEISSYAWSFTQGAMNCTTGTIESTISSPSWTFDEPGEYDVCLKVCNDGGCDVAIETVTVLDGSPGAVFLTNPLGPEDRNTDLSGLNDGLYEQEDLDENNPLWTAEDSTSQVWKAVYAVSNKDNAYVMAVASGEVISVEPMAGYYSGTGPEDSILYRDIAIPQPVTQSAIPALYRTQSTHAYVVRVRYLPEATNVHIFIEYIVVAPRVEVGDVISEGCIIGQTLKLLPFGPAGDRTVPVASPDVPGFGIVAIAAWEFEPGFPVTYFQSREAIDLYESLVIDRLPSNDCDGSALYSSCAGDADLSSPSDWTSQGTVLWNTGPGVVLYPGSVIFRSVYLDDSVDYGLDVNATRQQASPGQLTIQLGSSSQVFPVETTSGVYSIPLGDHGASPVLLRIANTGTVPIQISRACVGPNSGDGDGVPVGGTCQVANPYFALGLAGWTTSGVTLLSDLYTGTVQAADGATLEQNVTLMEGDHTIEVIVGAPSAWLLASGTVLVEYNIADTWFEVGEFAASEFFLSPDYRIKFSSSFSLEGNYQGEFSIRVTLDGLTGSVYLYQICIKPNVLPTVGTGGPLPQFNMRCDQRVPPPEAANNAISSWTWFLWNSLDQFFQCDLMLMLNKMLLAMNDGISFMRWQAAYWQAYAATGINWANNTALPWLAGHLSNIAQGRSSITVQTNQVCDNLFCLADSFFRLVAEFITDKVQTIINLISSILNVVAAALAQGADIIGTVLLDGFINIISTQLSVLVTLFEQALEYSNAILIAYEVSEPIPIPGLPNCGINPRDSIACHVFWLADNTIFSGRGALIMPLVIAILSIHVLLTAFEMVRSTFFRARQAI